MNNKTKTNSISLYVWVAENGDQLARKEICAYANITSATLCRILKGHMPKFEIRYRIYKLTGIKLLESDDFPELSKMNAS